jgi:hypothetical protein
MATQEVEQLLEQFALATQQSIAGLASEMREEAAETRRQIAESAAETRRYVDESAVETRRYVDEVAVDLRQYVDDSATETRRHFGVAEEGLRRDIQRVAEQVIAVDQKLERFRGEVTQEFIEVKSMIRLSYSELDRRLRTLEDVVLTLQARVERLEAA